MSLKEDKRIFEQQARKNPSVLLSFKGVEGFDVYNCSIPFNWQGREYLYGRVESRKIWATSWVRLFERSGQDEYTVVPESMIYQMEDPFVQFIGEELILGGTHVRKEAGKVKTFYGYFYRGKAPDALTYFTTGPDAMKDIRLVPLQNGRIGVFSRPRGEAVERKYGSGSVIGYTEIQNLNELTADTIEQAPVIDKLFEKGEWGGCNQCYPLKDGRIGVIGHKCYQETDQDGLLQSVYINIAFIFDPVTHTAAKPQIIATRASYPDAPAKIPQLKDCAFTSGIVKRTDGKVDLYSGVGDTHQGRVVIENPFPGLF